MKRLLAILTFVLLVLAGCAMPESNEALLELNENLEFGGLLLGMTDDAMREELGEPDAENPMTSGMECSYQASDISAALDDDGVIRRLSSKNGEFSLFGVKVGDELAAAGETLEEYGYTRDAASGYRYNKNEVQVILLTMDDKTVVGLTAEWLE